MSFSLDGLLLDGRYRIGAEIGAGNMSVVREAEDLRLMRQVAVKFVRRGSPDERVERLFREAKAAARANHAAVVTVFGYGTDSDTGLHYLVMERLHGEDLARRMGHQGILRWQEAVRLGAEIADALDHVHRAGVVHRDLKPANVFLARRGLREDVVTLLDFGVARQLDLHTLTGSGEVVGTLAYMAPEQILDSRKVGACSDLYALGVLLYECMTGQLPPGAQSLLQLATQVMEGADRAISLTGTDAPAALSALLTQCLRRDPQERPASARALCDSLLRLSAKS